eukprot:12560577-Ditylum_brightwellii.AAC.1
MTIYFSTIVDMFQSLKSGNLTNTHQVLHQNQESPPKKQYTDTPWADGVEDDFNYINLNPKTESEVTMKVSFVKFAGYNILRCENGKKYNGPAKFYGYLRNQQTYYKLEPEWLLNKEDGWTKYIIQKCMNNKGNLTETEPGNKATTERPLKTLIDDISLISLLENVSSKWVPPLTDGNPV